MRWIVLVTFVIGFLLGIGLGPGTPDVRASDQAERPAPSSPSADVPAVTFAGSSATHSL